MSVTQSIVKGARACFFLTETRELQEEEFGEIRELKLS